MSNKLKLWFDKNINDIKGCLPNGEKGRWDIYLLFNAFLGIKILDDNNLITELKNRGYDISTIKFEITKKNSEIQPITTKDLTLDMWDKSIVNKIKRLEKSIELNNKVKKDLKKQLDQLKQQLAEKEQKFLEFQEDSIRNEQIYVRELAEKDKEIEMLNTIKNNAIECADLFKVALSVRQKDLAIQELEKLKASADKWFDSWENSKYEGNIYDKLDVSNAYLQMSCEIDQQIKELKGEKNDNY